MLADGVGLGVGLRVGVRVGLLVGVGLVGVGLVVGMGLGSRVSGLGFVWAQELLYLAPLPCSLQLSLFLSLFTLSLLCLPFSSLSPTRHRSELCLSRALSISLCLRPLSQNNNKHPETETLNRYRVRSPCDYICVRISVFFGFNGTYRAPTPRDWGNQFRV